MPCKLINWGCSPSVNYTLEIRNIILQIFKHSRNKICTDAWLITLVVGVLSRFTVMSFFPAITAAMKYLSFHSILLGDIKMTA